MSDVPEGYYLGPNGEMLVEFRRRPNLDFIYLGGEHPRGPKKIAQAKRKRDSLLRRDGNLCHYCDEPMPKPSGNVPISGRVMTIEHIVPRSVGGSNELYNLVLACYQCNQEKEDSLNKCDCDFCEEAVLIFRSRCASL